MYDRILLALGDEEGPGEPVSRAFDLAREHGAAVNALYVVDTTTTGEPALSSLELLNIDCEDSGLTRLAGLAKQASAMDVEFSWKLCHGPFEEAIQGYEEEIEPDLIIVDGVEVDSTDALPERTPESAMVNRP